MRFGTYVGQAHRVVGRDLGAFDGQTRDDHVARAHLGLALQVDLHGNKKMRSHA